MNVQLLIDSFVRQTMVLIAQMATAGGVRTPLSQVANQVFLDLVAELHRQGLGSKIIADMFGLALRSYQQKVRRLSESATDKGITLWEAMHRYLQEKQVLTRSEILGRFCRDDDTSVKGILNDLVESGLVYKTGRGDGAVYRVVPADEIAKVESVDPMISAASLAWVAVYRNGPLTREQLQDSLPLEAERLERALAGLVADGRVAVEQHDGQTVYTSEQCLIPVGDPAGWEAGLLDHYQAVVATLCAKLRDKAARSGVQDRIGGSTYAFDVWAGHPCQERVYGLLASFRQQLSELWDEVAEHNRAGKPAEGVSRVTFYCGQTVRSDRDECEDEAEAVVREVDP